MTTPSNNQALTKILVNQLDTAGLIVPWPLQLDTGSAQPTSVAGVFQINETALQHLPGTELVSLAQSGALAIVYAQLLSVPRLAEFSKRYSSRGQDMARQVTDGINLDNLYDDQDVVRF